MKLNIISYLAIIIVLLFVSLSVQTCRVSHIIEERDQAEADRSTALQFATDQKNITEGYINKFNNQVAKTQSLEMSISNIRILRNSERLEHLKQFEALKKKLNNLEQSISIDASINEDSIPFKIIMLPCKDSVKLFHYQLVDNWNTISAMVLDTPKFDIKVPIRSVVYWQRKNKFLWWRVGKKQWILESMSPNPLVTVTEQELIRVSKKK